MSTYPANALAALERARAAEIASRRWGKRRRGDRGSRRRRCTSGHGGRKERQREKHVEEQSVCFSEHGVVG